MYDYDRILAMVKKLKPEAMVELAKFLHEHQGDNKSKKTCPDCGGSGHYGENPRNGQCVWCSGTGKVLEKKEPKTYERIDNIIVSGSKSLLLSFSTFLKELGYVHNKQNKITPFVERIIIEFKNNNINNFYFAETKMPPIDYDLNLKFNEAANKLEFHIKNRIHNNYDKKQIL